MTNKEFFLKRLSELPSSDRAYLKRAFGKTLDEADGSAITAFYKVCPKLSDTRFEDRWFFAATVYCLWSKKDRERLPSVSMKDAMSRLYKTASDSSAKTLSGILDCAWSQDGYLLRRLCHVIKRIKSSSELRLVIDAGSLLDDILHWNYDSRYIQRAWARAMLYVPASDESEENAPASSSL